MDRNSIIGIVLIMALVVTWFFFFGDQGQQQQQAENQTPKDTSEQVAQDTARDTTSSTPEIAELDSGATPVNEDSLAEVRITEDYGMFAPSAVRDEDTGSIAMFRVKTDKFDIGITPLGGMIREIYLNEYKTYDQEPLPVVNFHAFNTMSIQFVTLGERIRSINSETLVFEPKDVSSLKVSGENSKSVSFRAKTTRADGYLEFVYTFYGDKYDYDLEVKFTNIQNQLRDKTYRMTWRELIPKTEKTFEEQRAKSGIVYRVADDVEELPGLTEEVVEEKPTGQLDWIAFRNQFFTHALMADVEGGSRFSSTKFKMVTPNGDYIKAMEATFSVPITSKKMKFVAGPLEYYTMASYDVKLDRQLNLGWGPLKYVNAWVIIPIFKFLEGSVGNYGIIILILALLIKIVVSPLTFKTYISGAKMRIANQTDEVKALEKKYKDDSTKLQQEKMSLYRKLGVNPFGGCLPMLLQYPILISMFFFFPTSIELRQESFLWAEDLSTYDSILELGFSIPGYGDHVSLFTLLMAVSIFIYTLINQKTQGQMNTNPIMKWFPYIMPVFLLVFLNNYSAGLSYYYFLSNLISISQTALTKFFVDDEKILAQIRETAAKRKKSGKKSRMERWMEKQQQKQKELQRSKRK